MVGMTALAMAGCDGEASASGEPHGDAPAKHVMTHARLIVGARPDTDVWIDGQRYAPFVRGLRVELTPGEHVLESRRGDVVVGANTVRVEAGLKSWVDLSFMPATEPAPPTPEPPHLPGHVVLPTTVRESGDGVFDAQVVVRTIDRQERALDDCYEIALGAAPEVRGPVTLSMVVLESGRVESAEILRGSIGDNGDACVQGVLERVRFNPGPEGAPMTYELELGFAPD